MKLRRIVWPTLALIGFSAGITFLAASLPANAPPQGAAGAGVAADNTKSNKGASPTADNSKSNKTDMAITKKIRSAVVGDKSLSTYAHNVKIVTQDGKVTLAGPVRSDDEKSNIESKATAVAGDGNVTDQMTVAPKQ
jgi:hyperosmotically inducible protein